MSKRRARFKTKKKRCSIRGLRLTMKTLHSEMDLGWESNFHFWSADVRGEAGDGGDYDEWRLPSS